MKCVDFVRPGCFLNERRRILPRHRRPAAVQLQNHVGRRPLGEQVPVGLAAIGGELALVVVEAARHAERPEPCRRLVEGVGQRAALLRIGERRVARHDEEAAADGLMELDGTRDDLVGKCAGAHVRAGHLQIQVVEAPAQLGGSLLVADSSRRTRRRRIPSRRPPQGPHRSPCGSRRAPSKAARRREPPRGPRSTSAPASPGRPSRDRPRAAPTDVSTNRRGRRRPTSGAP